jgi:predicted outer membrane lipoprotein
MTYLAFVVGLLLGATLGVIVMAMAVISKSEGQT